jgi:prolipoprotein diacylglyceryltransferase
MILWRPLGYLIDSAYLSLHVEALFTMLSVAIALWWFHGQLQGYTKREKIASHILLVSFGLLGGWIWFFIQHFHDVHRIGLQSYGVMMGAGIAFMVFCFLTKRRKTLWLADRFVPAMALGIFVYRMGCFLYGDVPGTPTRLPWGVYTLEYGSFGELTVHPVALYLSLLGLALFVVLHRSFVRVKCSKGASQKVFVTRFDGEVASYFLLLYGVGRFFIEFFAAGHHYTFATIHYGLSTFQWAALVLGCIGILGLLFGYLGRPFLREA